VIVNPYDVDTVTDSLRDATEMDYGQARIRMQRLRRTVQREDVFKWAGDCLAELEAF
jgi:trehalose 6-phosphate synthase